MGQRFGVPPPTHPANTQSMLFPGSRVNPTQKLATRRREFSADFSGIKSGARSRVILAGAPGQLRRRRPLFNLHPEMSDTVDEPRPEQGNVNTTKHLAENIDWSQFYDMFMKIEQRLPNFDHMLIAMLDYAFQRSDFLIIIIYFVIAGLMTE